MITSRFIIIFFAIILVAFLAPSEELPTKAECPSNPYTGKREKYIVMFKKGYTDHIEKHFTTMQNCWNRSVKHAFTKIGNFSKSKDDENILNDFSVKGAREGYSAWFDPLLVKEYLSKLEEVEFVELVSSKRELDISNVTRTSKRKLQRRAPVEDDDPNDNLDRIDQANLPLDKIYRYDDSAGANVNVYVIDSGVRITHGEFEGRAVHGATFCVECADDEDEEGHGTLVASVIAGHVSGVARKANIISVKVGQPADEVIQGIQWVVSQHQSSDNKNTVVNLSLGYRLVIDSLNAATQSLIDSGIHVIISGGNDKLDACLTSPNVPGALIVASTKTLTDEYAADFSNFGTCIDIFAPGTDIIGAGIESDDDVAEDTGTSFAAAHVSGTVALYISQFGNRSPAEVENAVKFELATQNVVINVPQDTTNRLVRIPVPQ